MGNQSLPLNTRASIEDLTVQERAAYVAGNVEKADLLRQLIQLKRRVIYLEAEIEDLMKQQGANVSHPA